MRTHTEIASGWTFRKVAAKGAPEDAWLPATVPGCVHTDLFAAGKIGDPFHRLNEKDQQWIENESWEYRTTVAVDAATLARERVELVFAGLDTFAEVFVNGAPVLTADNMFRSWRVDVKAQLRAGRRTTIRRALRARRSRRSSPPTTSSATSCPPPTTRARRWSACGRARRPTTTAGTGARASSPAASGGRWRWRRGMRRASTTCRSSRTSWTRKAAELGIVARVVAARAGRARVTVAMPGGPTLGHADVTLKPGVNDVKLGARIEKPELWWPDGLGPQRLYTLETGWRTATERRATRARRASACGRSRSSTSATRRARASSSRSTARPCS